MQIQHVRTKLLLVFLSLIFLVLLFLSGVSYYVSPQALNKSLDSTALAIGSDYSHRIQGDMDLLVGELEGFADVDFVREGTDIPRIVTAMHNMKQRISTLGTIAYIAPDGQAITSENQKVSYADREYFKTAMSTKKWL